MWKFSTLPMYQVRTGFWHSVLDALQAFIRGTLRETVEKLFSGCGILCS